MKLVEVTALPKFRLHLRYESGESGQVDLTPMVGRGVFSAWNKPGFFEQVQLSPEGAPHWSGEIDLCPDALFSDDWQGGDGSFSEPLQIVRACLKFPVFTGS